MPTHAYHDVHSVQVRQNRKVFDNTYADRDTATWGNVEGRLRRSQHTLSEPTKPTLAPGDCQACRAPVQLTPSSRQACGC